MEKDNSLVFLNFQKITNAITSGNPEGHENNEHIETDPELTNENEDIDEDDNRAGIFLSPYHLITSNDIYPKIHFLESSLGLYQELDKTLIFLDVIMHLSKELDERSPLEKISHIWTQWTSKKDLFDGTSKGSFLFDIFIWCLR